MAAEATDPLMMLAEAVALSPADDEGGKALAALACDMTRPGAPVLPAAAAAVILAIYARRRGHVGSLDAIADRLLPVLDGRPRPELGALFAGGGDGHL